MHLYITGSKSNVSPRPPGSPKPPRSARSSRPPRSPERASADPRLISANIAVTERVGRAQRPASVGTADYVRRAH